MAANHLEKRTYTVPEFAKLMGLGRSLVYQLVKEGRMPVPVIRLGKRIVVPRAAVDKLLCAEEKPQQEKPNLQEH